MHRCSKTNVVTHKGVNPGGDGGDASPPVFGVGGTNILLSPPPPPLFDMFHEILFFGNLKTYCLVCYSSRIVVGTKTFNKMKYNV